MNMRKIIAVLSAVLMLCSLLPMAAFSVSAADDNVVYSQDFESGLGTWASGDSTNAPVAAATPPVANANGGSYALQQTITNGVYPYMVDKTAITLEANTDYVMTFDSLATNAGWPVKAILGGNYWLGTVIAQSDSFSDTSATEWKTYSFEFNSGSNTKAYVGLKCTWTNTTVYFDNVKIEKKVEEPDSGETTGTAILEMDWNDGVVGFNSGSVVAEGPDGSNCFKWDAAGSWSSTAITVSPVEKDVNYTVTFKAKAASATGVYLTFQDTAWYEPNYFNQTVNVTTEWAEYTVTADIGRYCKNGSIYFKFQDQGSANTFYVDDLKIVKVETADDGGDDYSDENLVKNGDFELGTTANWSVHNGTTVTTDAKMNGSYGLHGKGSGWAGIASQTITVTNGQAYKFSFWYYINNTDGTGFNYALKGTSSGTSYKAYWPSNAGEWTKVEVEFIATDDSQLNFNLSGYNSSSTPDFYIDDVVLVEMKSPSNDGYIVNGDFEVGSTTGWETWQDTAVSKTAAKDGDYGLIVKGNGGWGGTLKQSFTMQANREYILSFDIKAISNGFNLKITDDLAVAGGESNAKLWGIYYATSISTDWKHYEITFYAGDNTTAAFQCVGSGIGTTDEIYLDNISITKVGGEDPVPNNNVTGGQTSVKDASESSKGLAFRFNIAGIGAEIDSTNAYVAGSADVKLYKDRDDLYKLVKAGAIVTNNMTVGKGDMGLDNVDGKKTINVDAKYLCEVAEDAFAFAVRILNIPEANLNTNIFARPYFVYEDEDGNEQVIYGNTKSENYAHAANPKASIKVLAIGNSFSQDATYNHLYEVLESAGYEEIVIANMYIGGCSLDTHWSNMQGSSEAYTYYYRSNSTNGWRTTYNQTLDYAMAEEAWDYITIQQVSGSSGVISDYGNLDNCLNWINDNKSNVNAKILWHMTWAYDEATSNSSFSKYNNDQLTMYRKILDTTNEKIVENGLIDGIIPSGTAIQNMRTSTNIVASNLCASDGYHLNDTYGDYVAAMTWYAYLSGDDVTSLEYQPDAIGTALRKDINDSVNAAIENPFNVTKCASYDTTKSIKVLSIGHSFSVDVMGTYLYQMLEQAGYEDITIGYLYYPGCQLSRHWEYISTNTNGHERYGKNETGSWVTKSSPYAIDVLRDEDWDYVTLQVSPDYVGGDKPSSGYGAGRVEYDYLPLMINWIQENALNANVDIKFHQIWAYSEGCDLWSYTYHDYDQMTMYENIIAATQQYVATNEDITGIIPCGTAVQNGRALLGDIFNMPDASQGGSDGYHLNEMYGDFLGSLTWACYFSGVDAHTITERSADMTEEEFDAIADAVNAALADWTQVTVG